MRQKEKIGVLHPGQMGISLAAALIANQHSVSWASQSRSQATQERANSQGLLDVGSLKALCAQCDILFGVCPPGEAFTQAAAVSDAGFSGTYVDCNAIAPATSTRIADHLAGRDITYVDGGIIGPPAWRAGSTRLYLSGQEAAPIASLFADSLMETALLDESTGSASALKMAYAAWTKGSDALLLNVFALAEHHQLGDALKQEWSLSQKGLEQKLDRAASINAPKAWRFVGEMQQIEKTLTDANLPAGAFESAAAVYDALGEFKSRAPEDISTEEVIETLISNSRRGTHS